ncbi:hypothetical protein H6G41_32310 [Tolypothrix sp. FACHB-123]|nr:hypothetical protein [Tolypothrix sp. FACHB-123]
MNNKTSSCYSIASGYNAIASGNNSIASGYNAIASAYNSSASGYNAIASAYNSIASGDNSIASTCTNQTCPGERYNFQVALVWRTQSYTKLQSKVLSVIATEIATLCSQQAREGKQSH